jgi:putative transposase
MARPLRIDIPDGWYHVSCRGIERRSLYTSDQDREHFLELLEGVVERFRIRLHCYALLPNHFHLLVSTPDANLSAAMQWLKLSYSAWFNAKHNRVGPLFQGRFKSTPVENSAWGYEVSLYIHLNPVMLVKLGLGKSDKKAESLGWKAPEKEQVKERLAKLRKYRWSSYGFYAGFRSTPAWMTVDEVLSRASKNNSDKQKAYREDAKQRISKGLPLGVEETLLEGFALGAEKFRVKVKTLAKSGREIAGKDKLRRKLSFEELVSVVEKIRGRDSKAFMNSRGDWGRPLLLLGARRYCGLTLQEIGDKIGGTDYAAVSVMLKRFEKKVAGDPVLARKVEALKRTVEC